MKALRMSKVVSAFKRKNTSSPGPADAGPSESPVSNVLNGTEGPEYIATHNVRLFCESGGTNPEDEILYLPPIVDAAESSPAAAAECARLIRKYLKKDRWSRPSYQYNAIMLVRILADNPGPTFTRNLDGKFVDAARELINTPDPSVRQMIMETLDSFEHNKFYDEGLAPLISMWQREKHTATATQPSRSRHFRRQQSQPHMPPPTFQMAGGGGGDPHSQNYFARSHSSRRLPDPIELASRLEEARTSAKVLQDIVTNTPHNEVLGNDLIKEFADRCQSASRSIQGYMTSTDPAPDNDTMESLIDTNEGLQASLSLHQRAMLNARKQAGLGTRAEESPAPVARVERREQANGSSSRSRPASVSSDGYDSDSPPPMPMRPQQTNGKGKGKEYDPYRASSGAGPSRSDSPPAEDPFKDPEPEPRAYGASAAAGGSSRRHHHEDDDEPRLAYEPFNPGFNTASADRQDMSTSKEVVASSPSHRDESPGGGAPGSSAQERPVYRY